MVAQKMNTVKSPSPPPVPPLPSSNVIVNNQQPYPVPDSRHPVPVTSRPDMDKIRNQELEQLRALKDKEAKLKQELTKISSSPTNNRISLEDTFKEIEISTMELKEMAEKRDDRLTDFGFGKELHDHYFCDRRSDHDLKLGPNVIGDQITI